MYKHTHTPVLKNTIKTSQNLNRLFIKEDIWIASKHMNRCLPPLVIREMQIKTTMSAYYVPGTMSSVKRLTIPNVGEDMEEPQLSYMAGWNIK